MALHVIIGLDGHGSTAQARCLYAGQSKQAAMEAMDADTASVRFECFHNATSLRKNNTRYAAAAIKQPSSPATVAGDGAESDAAGPAAAAADSVPSSDPSPAPPPVTGRGKK